MNPNIGKASDDIQILVLATYHFDSPGEDAVQADIADVLEPERQEEILALVDRLSEFEPTKVAVELVPEHDAGFDSLYVAYREGRHELSRNERQQLGMRLADRLSHSRLYPIDHQLDAGFRDLIAYAQKHDPDFMAYFQQWVQEAEAMEDSLQVHLGVGENIRRRNEPDFLERLAAPYARMAEVGEGDSYIGADVYSRWVQRNARIFANIARIAEPRDRILVIIGSSHAVDLRLMIENHPNVTLVDPLEYL